MINMNKLIENIIKNTMISLFEENQNKNKRSDFLGTLLYSISRIHELHLLAKSYSEHEVLDDLYNNLLDDVDELIEIDLGKNGYINKYNDKNEELWSYDPIKYLNNLKNYIEVNQDNIYKNMEHNSIFSKLDDIVEEIDKCIYKLTNLK